MSVLTPPILCRRSAMNTWFEIILLGDDSENLHAAGEAALDEVERIEKLLSRFDPASEVSRLNRDAALKTLLVDFEMAQVLETCREACRQTGGFFDITVNRENKSNFADIVFDFDRRLIAFKNHTLRLDFGAFGKGYALDCAANCLREFGVKKALLHGGTSSVLAIGRDADDELWKIGLHDSEQQICLTDAALSTSATGAKVSDILVAHSRTPLQAQAACSVVTKTAAQAEIFSTALLCMGKERAVVFVAENKSLQLKMFWADTGQPSNTCL